MSYDREVFIDKLYQIEEKKKQSLVLGAERVAAEEKLAVEYKVAEFNNQNALLVKTFQAKTSVLRSEIKVLQDSLVI